MHPWLSMWSGIPPENHCAARQVAASQIGKWGQLQEWMTDLDDPKEEHRHLSHLIAVHPGRQISPLTTPKFAEAAKVSMNARGDGATGWSLAWKICIWARHRRKLDAQDSERNAEKPDYAQSV